MEDLIRSIAKQSSTLVRCVAVAAVALCAVGCSSTIAPRVQVEAVRPIERTEDGIRLSVECSAQNLNDKGVALRMVSYAMWIDGQRVFVAERSPEVTLTAARTETFTLPAFVPAHVMSGPELSYRFVARVGYMPIETLSQSFVSAGYSDPAVRVTEEGVLIFESAEESGSE